jgi:UDP:flavonoid glycosyltransferase YjiC (YdhE family)
MGSAGDVYPLLALGRLRARGHQPVIIANAVFRQTVERPGAGRAG